MAVLALRALGLGDALTAGPALGAAIFLTWLGGLVWGVLASLL